jgi:hypothetical protein
MTESRSGCGLGEGVKSNGVEGSEGGGKEPSSDDMKILVMSINASVIAMS